MKATKRTNEFKTLQLKHTEDSVSPHTIYFKEHSVREQSKDRPSGRTLFVVNVPPYADENGLSNAFREAGNVQTVQLCLKPCATESKIVNKFIPEEHKPYFRVAYVVFEKVKDMDNALQLTKLNPLNSNEHIIKLGMKKWIDEYNCSILQSKTLKDKVESFMKNHDQEMKKAEEKEKKLEQEDNEGWVTVTKRGKIQSFARTEKVENKIMEKEQKNKKRKELKNFYTFQIRESKMKHIVALRQKFAEDKKKIAQIKQNRRFKPF